MNPERNRIQRPTRHSPGWIFLLSLAFIGSCGQNDAEKPPEANSPALAGPDGSQAPYLDSTDTLPPSFAPSKGTQSVTASVDSSLASEWLREMAAHVQAGRAMEKLRSDQGNLESLRLCGDEMRKNQRQLDEFESTIEGSYPGALSRYATGPIRLCNSCLANALEACGQAEDLVKNLYPGILRPERGREGSFNDVRDMLRKDQPGRLKLAQLEVNGIRIGMSIDQLDRALGRRITPTEHSAGEISASPLSIYITDGRVSDVFCEGQRCRTVDGITSGNTKARVESVYGKAPPDNVMIYESDEPDCGLTLSIPNGKVGGIRAWCEHNKQWR